MIITPVEIYDHVKPSLENLLITPLIIYLITAPVLISDQILWQSKHLHNSERFKEIQRENSQIRERTHSLSDYIFRNRSVHI